MPGVNKTLSNITLLCKTLVTGGMKPLSIMLTEAKYSLNKLAFVQLSLTMNPAGL